MAGGRAPHRRMHGHAKARDRATLRKHVPAWGQPLGGAIPPAVPGACEPRPFARSRCCRLWPRPRTRAQRAGRLSVARLRLLPSWSPIPVPENAVASPRRVFDFGSPLFMKGCRMSRGPPDFASGAFGLWGPVPAAFALLARRASSRRVDRLSPSRPLHSKVPLWPFFLLLLLLSLVRAPAEGSRGPTYSFVLLHVCRRGLAAGGGHTISSGAGGPHKRRSQRLAAWTIAG